MTQFIFLLPLIILVFLLSLTPLFQGSRKQKEYEKGGMKLVSFPRTKQMLLPALGILSLAFVGFFAFLSIKDGAWKEADNMKMMLLCIGIVILLAATCFLGGYCLQKRHILYDAEKLLIGKPFRPYEEIRWYEIARMKIKNQDFFDLYDRNEKRRISVDANMEGYSEFYQMALAHIKPEYSASSGQNTSYQKKFAVQGGCGILRYRTGEYYVLLVLSLLVTGMFLAALFSSGEDIPSALKQIWDEKIYGILFVPVFLFGSLCALIYVNLQKINYDRKKIVFKRFPHRETILLWQDVYKIECVMDKTSSQKIILYTHDKTYIIREAQFRRGFSELLYELSKRY